jgi:hypothetical protein
MAAKEPFDFLSASTLSASTFLDVSPQRTIIEYVTKQQVVHHADDGSEQRISLDNTPHFYATLTWDYLNESDAGVIFEFYTSSELGNGVSRSFKWESPAPSSHVYVVRFDGELERARYPASLYGVNSIRLKLLGTT